MNRRSLIALATALSAGASTGPLGCAGSTDTGADASTPSSGEDAGTGSTGPSGADAGAASSSSGSSSSGGGSNGGSSSGSGGGASSGGSSSSSGGASADAGTITLGDGGAACTGNEDVAGGFPAGFWDASNIPTGTGPVIFKFLNRTNGQHADSELYWSFQNTNLGVNETHSIADQATYAMPTPGAGANGGYNGRMYFYICPTGSPSTCPGSTGATDYYDFIEFAIGNNTTPPPYWINYDTTRVDAFAIKLALDLHVTTGPDYYSGENCPTFAEDRTATFASYVASVPAEFKPCGQAPNAPYRIPEPGSGCGFNAGGANADYFNSFEQEIWTNNGITIPMPGPNGSGLGSYPDLSAAIFRHVGAAAGTWNPDGTLVNGSFWSTSTESTFYRAAPADYYAQWIHSRAIHNKQYGFPYDDVGGNSSDVGASGMVYMLVAIGW